MTTVPKYQWQPSTAEIAARAGIAAGEVVRFDHNTSPYKPEWVEEEAARAALTANEYPAADYRPLREAAAAYAGVEPAEVMVGAGADELILLAAKAFLTREAVAVADDPTYTLYRIATLQQGADYRTVARAAPDFSLPTAQLEEAAAGAAVLWLCQPHNPTGERAPDEMVARLVEAAGGVVVLDAAYAEFAGDSWAAWVRRYPHLVVLHTMSKAFGLASIRVGYSLSSPGLAERLDGVRPPGSISTVSAALAIRALGQPELAKGNVAALTEERTDLARRLAALGMRVRTGDANFVLCEVGAAAPALADRLMADGLVVRSYSTGPLAGYLRFTVRTRPDHDRLLAALERNMT